MSELIHYTFAMSPSAYRTRIAFNLKGLKPEERYVHLLRDGGQQHAEPYAALNPQEIVPTLVHDGKPIGQTLAIIEYLDELYPEPPLFPKDPYERAHARQIALAVIADMHPLNSLRVRKYLTKTLELDEAQIGAWYRHWMSEGFEAVEAMLSPDGPHAMGDTVTVADVVLIPQVASARKFNIPMDAFPRIMRCDGAARALPAFADAAPERQPDYGK